MPALPDKQYFKIGEVAELAGVEPHVLRYWETEFRGIRPEKTRTGQRMYRRKDVELVLQVKGLLYDEGFRIDGAKRRLRELSGEESPAQMKRVVAEIQDALEDFEKILDDDEKAR